MKQECLNIKYKKLSKNSNFLQRKKKGKILKVRHENEIQNLMKKYFLNKMSTGKRLAKRSIIGTRVCAMGSDGLWYSGVIHAVKTPSSPNVRENNNCINLTPNTKYTVRFGANPMEDLIRLGLAREFRDTELIGPGFRNILDVKLNAGQKIFITYNGRESSGEVVSHDESKDEVAVQIYLMGQEVSIITGRRNVYLTFNESRIFVYTEFLYTKTRHGHEFP